jgi:hypothetical protein
MRARTMKPRTDTATRSADKCTKWHSDAHYGFEDLVCDMGGLYECLKPEFCEKVEPVSKANREAKDKVWQKPTDEKLQEPPPSF